MNTREFYQLTVLDTHQPIAAAKSIVLDVPDALKKTFCWRPGQHITLRFEIKGEEVRRSYTISTSPISENLRITVKRVQDGLVSNYINDTIESGDTIDVLPPFGRFCLDPDIKKRRTHYFFGAGSGITPLFSMLSSVLLAEPHSFAYLLYGNTDENSIIFHKELDALAAKHPKHLKVRYMLSKRTRFSTFKPWHYGRIDADTIQAFIKAHPPYAQDAQYYVCGPGNMNAAVKLALQVNHDVPPARIHSETFGGNVEIDTSFEGIAAQATITLKGQSHKVRIAHGQTLLDAMIAAGMTPPYSCQAGICGACHAKLTDGSVHMQARMALEDTDIQQGTILTCQAVAKTDTLALTFT